MNYSKPTDHYLTQRVLSASPEQLVAILLEGGQRYLGMAINAMERKDYRQQASSLSRVGEFILELGNRLNLEEGGELAANLDKLYAWWTTELFEASRDRDLGRLRGISQMMGELRTTWEELHTRNIRGAKTSEFLLGDRVI
jgi:flagellar protein FliS